MLFVSGWPVAVLALVGGFALGAAARVWLGRLRRGVTLPFGSFEVGCALVAGAGAALSPPSRLPMVLWIGLLAAVLSAVDLRHHRLPDAITLPAVPVTVLVAAVTLFGWPGSGSVWRALLGGAVLGGVFYLLALAAPAGMGRGDAKLSLSLGVATGYFSWSMLVLAVVAGFVIGALAAVAAVVLRRATMRSSIPFGPALLTGCWLALVLPVTFFV